MERTFTVRYEIEIGPLSQVRKKIHALGGTPIREGEFEMLGDNKGEREIRSDDAFVVAQYTVNEIDVLKGKIPNIMKISGIKKAIIFGDGLTLFTPTSIAKIILPTVGVGVVATLTVYLSDAEIWEFLGGVKSIVQAGISIAGFGAPALVLILAEWSKRKKIKEAYEKKNGEYKKIDYGDYEDLMRK